MANALTYYGMDKPILPYKSFTSPVDESPHFVYGSQNVLALASGYLTKRNGFSDALETALSAVPGVIKRIFGWKRWAGSATNPGAFIVMLGTVESGRAMVWKYQIGTDASFSLLWTETGATAIPFDFIDSNNFVFFGNASTRVDMRKFDSVDCTLWGLDPPPSAPTFSIVSGVLPDGLEFDELTGTLSGTPTTAGSSTVTVTATDSAAGTATQTFNLNIDTASLSWGTRAGALPPAVQGAAYSSPVAVQGGTGPYTYTLYSGALPAGLTLSASGVVSGIPTAAGNTPFAVKATDSASTPAVLIRSFSLFVGSSAITLMPTTLPDAAIGNAYSTQLTPAGGTAPYTLGFAGGNVPAGIMFTASAGLYYISGTPTTAGVYPLTIRVTDSTGPTANVTEFVYSLTVDASALTITTAALPDPQVGVAYSQIVAISGGTGPYAFAYTAGSLTAQTGYVGGYTYTSKYGHESAMSALSDNTGLFTDQDLGWDFIASSDPQVTGINYYRSTDGGAQDPAIMRLVVSLSNATESYEDSTQDIFLGNQTGPALFVNAPPQPLRGFQWSNGRIWGFNSSAEWFTGDEEITNGTPAECMSNAQNGNFYQWPSETQGIAVTDNGVDALLSEEVWQVTGDTLDTFRKSRILRGGGTLSPTCVCVVGNTVYWVDTSKQLWSSDKGEIGLTIRTDLADIDHEQTYICYHKAGRRNWLVILDGVGGKLLLYDMDLEQWQTPWTVAATALASVQTAKGTIDLLASFATGHVRKLSLTAYDDDGTTYADQMRSNLFPLVTGARTTARNTEAIRQVEQWEMETDVSGLTDAGLPNANHPDEFYMLVDDDPNQDLSFWIQLLGPQPLQFGRDDATGMAGTRWNPDVQAARRAAFCATWDAAATGWKVYSFDLAIKPSY